MHAPARPIDRYLAHYGDDHRNPMNQRVHLWCVPAIVWSIVALLWALPVPEGVGRPGLWAALAMLAALVFYWRLSRALGAGALVLFVAMGAVAEALRMALGAAGLAWLALAVFVVAWIGQFLGHRIEGRRPSFLTDLVYLLIGPLWTLGKLYRRLGWRW
ncbi:DUF962 domain-containing protein [Coralloluteibacterium stylophorae]|uniref:DUF962 domain-containing protein n=1 Tax=Coralloluteibacterium stylophorae TaxID=1776034 RepID=A0A8J7VSD8_9GAMM|nr:Mpo1-like protein [Coralloluteibacterium stylophorae]MBS7457875.1 DUF962 domain-containing protein [Coralloluteibacterium stylophorae]